MTDHSRCNATARAAQRLELARGSRLLSLALCGLLSACAIGPDYKRPQATTPAQYKEATGWRQAQPSDSLARGAWWELYGDPVLNDLVTKLNSGNQTVAQSEAQFRQARRWSAAPVARSFPAST